jgi:hypothetical protein
MSEGRVRTEEEWLSTADPVAMVRHLRDCKAPVRKLQLLAAAGFRVAAGADERLAEVPGAVERHADGLLGAAEREAALAALDRACAEPPAYQADRPREDFFRFCVRLSCRGAFGPPDDFGSAWESAANVVASARQADGASAGALLCLLMRCLFGNPWRPRPPRTFPAHVTGLAQSIDAAFPGVSPEYAILADALEELGEVEAAAHCRTELHAKGCHVLDWITGRE